MDGGPAKAGSIVQIGVVIVPPDFTGDINTYTLFYYTSDVKLAHLLEGQRRPPGAARRHLTYDLTTGAQKTARARAAAWHAVAVDRRHGRESGARGLIRRQLVESGTVGGSVKMSTNVPAIAIGDADLVLTTNPGGPAWPAHWG